MSPGRLGPGHGGYRPYGPAPISLLKVIALLRIGSWYPFYRFWRSLSDPCQSVTLLLVELVKRRRRDAQEQQAACQTPFQFIQFLSNQSAHSFSSFLHRNQKAPVP